MKKRVMSEDPRRSKEFFIVTKREVFLRSVKKRCSRRITTAGMQMGLTKTAREANIPDKIQFCDLMVAELFIVSKKRRDNGTSMNFSVLAAKELWKGRMTSVGVRKRATQKLCL